MKKSNSTGFNKTYHWQQYKKRCAELEKGALQCFVYTCRENRRALNFNCIHHNELGIHSNQIHSLDSMLYVYDPGEIFLICKIKYLYNRLKKLEMVQI